MAVDTSDMGAQAAAFVAELEALCRARGVQLCVSGYDSLQLWTLHDGDDPIRAPQVFDILEPQGAPYGT